MNKQELIQLHKLLTLFLDQIEHEKGEDLSQLFELDEIDTKPTDVHKTKTDQREAVLQYAEKLSQGIEEHGSEVDVIETEEEKVPVDEMKETKRRAQTTLSNQNKGISSDSDEEDTSQKDETSSGSGVDWSKGH